MKADALDTEAPAGNTVGAGGRPLSWDFRDLGFRFQWHDFEPMAELDWSGGFVDGSVEMCLNLEGQAILADARQTVELRGRSSVFYYQGKPPLLAKRRANEPPRCGRFCGNASPIRPRSKPWGGWWVAARST